MNILFYLLLFQLLPVSKIDFPEENAVSAVYYKFIYKPDTTNQFRIYSENMVLYIGKYSSAFESFDKIQEMNRSELNLNVETTNLSKAYNETIFFRFNKENKFIINRKELKDYVMEDNIKINWKILDSLKSIEGIECQKAEGNFRGRKYFVWFTTTIPLGFGPWKLGGLPGLIIEAYDSKNDVQFKFAGLEKANKSTYLIALPKGAISITKKEFKKIEEAIANDPIGYLNNTLGGTLKAPPGIKQNVAKKPNNPIELTED